MRISSSVRIRSPSESYSASEWTTRRFAEVVAMSMAPAGPPATLKYLVISNQELINGIEVYGLRTFARKLRTFVLRKKPTQNHIGTPTFRPRGAALQGTPPLPGGP